LGGGAIAVGKTLPQSWTRPVVESVMLPAHGAASVIEASITFGGEDDAVFLTFDGTSASFTNFDCCDLEDIPSTGGDRIIMVDRDSSNWDANDYESGGDEDIPVGDTNWSVTPDPGDGNDQGVYYLQATRIGGLLNGATFQVTLTVVFNVPDEEDAPDDTTVSASIVRTS
jgi:hypothetical protein